MTSRRAVVYLSHKVEITKYITNHMKSYRILSTGEIKEVKESFWSVLFEVVVLAVAMYLIVLLAGAVY